MADLPCPRLLSSFVPPTLRSHQPSSPSVASSIRRPRSADARTHRARSLGDAAARSRRRAAAYRERSRHLRADAGPRDRPLSGARDVLAAGPDEPGPRPRRLRVRRARRAGALRPRRSTQSPPTDSRIRSRIASSSPVTSSSPRTRTSTRSATSSFRAANDGRWRSSPSTSTPRAHEQPQIPGAHARLRGGVQRMSDRAPVVIVGGGVARAP